MFKVFKGLSPAIFAEAFPVRQQSQYNMRNYPYFAMPRAKTCNHQLEILSYIGSNLWDSIPSHMKEKDSINKFKHAKTGKMDKCSQQIIITTTTIIILIILLIIIKIIYTKIYICLGKSEYHNRFSRLPYVVHLLFLV